MPSQVLVFGNQFPSRLEDRENLLIDIEKSSIIFIFKVIIVLNEEIN